MPKAPTSAKKAAKKVVSVSKEIEKPELNKVDPKELTASAETNRVYAQKQFSTPSKKVKKLKPFSFKDNDGEDADPSLYFFSPEGEETVCPPYFNNMCGKPVDREDLLEEFFKVFDKDDGYLLYKLEDREVYVVIVPIHLSVVNREEDALPGDFQKHSMSFILEGSVNPTLFKNKLKLIRKSIRSLREE